MFVAAPSPLPIPFPIVIESQGFDWSVLVPVGAIAAAIVTSVVTVLSTNRQLALLRRSQWWERFTWASERVLHPKTADDAEYGLSVLLSMIDDSEVRAEDSELALALVNHVLDTRKKKQRGRRSR